MTAEVERGRIPLRPMTSAARVSVVMPVRAAAAVLEASVRAVLDQDPPVDEVVLAVAPSSDGTEGIASALAEADPRVRVVDNPSGRTPDGLRAAIAATDGEIVVRVDAHAVLPAGYVATAVVTLCRTGAANVGGRQHPVATSGFARCVAAAMRSPAGSGGATHRTGRVAGPADTVYLGVFRREALDAVGGFDPRLTRNQDAELNERLRRHGYLVWYEPSLVVEYRPRGTVTGLAAQYLGYGRWRRLTARMHPGSLRARQIAPPAGVLGLFGAAGVSVVRRRWSPFAVATGGYAAVLLAAASRAADRPSDIPGVVVALATMHVSWGIGFVVGPPRQDTRHC